MARWVGPSGWEFEAIILDRRPCFRVRQHGVLVQLANRRDPCSTSELERLLRRHGLTIDQFDEEDPDCE